MSIRDPVMRCPHYGKSFTALARSRDSCYAREVSVRSLAPTFLRAAAVALAAGGLGVWVATGAHRGWTRTSEVELRRDEITGIDYPVRRDKFTAGIEIPLASLGGAALLAGLATLTRRPGNGASAGPR